ncbi:MAG: SRPBCC family protein [Myxococcota bacterium]
MTATESHVPQPPRTVEVPLGRKEPAVDVPERWVSLIGGGVLTVYGIARGGVGGLALALAGGGLIKRGITGRSWLNRTGGALAVAEGPGALPGAREILIEKAVTVDRAPDEIYRFWRDLRNLPRFMRHLESVEIVDDRRSRWSAHAPLGMRVRWDAELVEEVPGERLRWRSLPGADMENAGAVQLIPAAGGRGTVMRVTLQYAPPAGAVGAAFARLFGEEPRQQVADDLRRLKQMLETGEVASTEGQPSGRY